MAGRTLLVRTEKGVGLRKKFAKAGRILFSPKKFAPFLLVGGRRLLASRLPAG